MNDAKDDYYDVVKPDIIAQGECFSTGDYARRGSIRMIGFKTNHGYGEGEETKTLKEVDDAKIDHVIKSGTVFSNNKSIRNGAHLNATGVEVINAALKYDQTYYPVFSGLKLTYANGTLTTNSPIIFYDKNKQVITTYFGAAPYSVTVPEGVAYVRFNMGTSPTYNVTVAEDYSVIVRANTIGLNYDLYMNDRGLDEYKGVKRRGIGSASNSVKSYAVKTYPLTSSGLINTVFYSRIF